MKHTPVSDTDYFEALPPNGLQLAEDQAREYLSDARKNEELPTRDVARGLTIVQQLKPQEQPA